MATLTYNPNEQQEGELTAEEKDSLAVGEKMMEQESKLLAGKYKDAEELEKAYVELQSKMSSGQKEEPVEEEEQPVSEEDQSSDQQEVDFFDKLWEESQSDSQEYSDDIKEALSNMDKADLAQAYLEQRYKNNNAPVETITQEEAGQLQDMVGGKERYGEMLRWASDSFSKEEIAMFDQVIDSGNLAAAFFAIQNLSQRFVNANGMEGQMITGKAPSADNQDVFKSQAAVVRAMKDPKYDSDPAYRQEVMEKLGRSNIQF